MAEATALGIPSVRSPREPRRTGLTYHIRTFGCQMNEHDSERISGLLATDGMAVSATLEDADIVVLNTCTIRENADNKLYGFLGSLRAVKNVRPGMKILVGGCSAQKDGDLVMEKAGWVDVVFGTHNVHRVVDLLDHADEWGPITEIWKETTSVEDFPSYLPARRQTPHSAWVTIAIGCDNSCTFCIVPTVRGREISRRFGDVIGEVKSLAEEGVTEVTLLGQNVNSYGRDLALNGRSPVFADLLRQVGEVDGIRRIRYTSPHPKDFKDDVAAAMAETPAVCEQLHLPLQSGSDRILAAMHRGYNADRFLSRLAMARRIVPNLAVSTDIIVGFPGETDADFAGTMDVVAKSRFDQAFTFQYSPRPGTPAASMDHQIDKAVVQERFDRLVTLQNAISLERNQEAVGRVEEVLVEGPSKKDPATMTARTRGNKPVHATGVFEPGTYLRVEITKAAPHHLLGERGVLTAVAVIGPTAAGKSGVALGIAARCGGEIVSVDSMQVYRGMDIGTAKADAAMRRQTPHHLLDICEPSHDMSVAEFQQEGREALVDVGSRGATPIICGGSGLHFRSLVDPLEFPPRDAAIRAELDLLDPAEARDRLVGLDPQAGEHVDLANPRRVVRALEVAALTTLVPSQRAGTDEAAAVRDYRPMLDFVAIGMDPGPDLEERVVARFDAMLERGLLAEVARLGPTLGRLAAQAVGYKELLPVVAGNSQLADGRTAAIRATRALAKRQRTFFRRDPRIYWVPWHPKPEVRIDAAIEYLNGQLSWTL